MQPRPNYLITKKSTIEPTGRIEHINVYDFKQLSTNSTYLASCTLYGQNLYHETDGSIYKFTHDKIEEMPNYSTAKYIQMQKNVSYYTLYANTIYEFIINTGIQQTDRGSRVEFYQVDVIRMEFVPDSPATKKLERISLEFDKIPCILTVNQCVLISNLYSFVNSGGEVSWSIPVRGPNAMPKLGTMDVKSVIYRLDTKTYDTISGIIDFDIVSDRFVVVFDAKWFYLLNIRTLEEKFTVESGFEQNKNKDRISVSMIMIPHKVPDLNVMQHAKKDAHKLRRARITNLFQIIENNRGRYKIDSYTVDLVAD